MKHLPLLDSHNSTDHTLTTPDTMRYASLEKLEHRTFWLAFSGLIISTELYEPVQWKLSLPVGSRIVLGINGVLCLTLKPVSWLTLRTMMPTDGRYGLPAEVILKEKSVLNNLSQC